MHLFSRRSRLAVIAGASLIGALTLAGAAPAFAVGIYPTKVTSNIRSQPTTNSSIVTTVGAGTQLSIDCYANGQVVNGTGLWDHWVGGGYISDSLVLTGSNNPVVPLCGSAPAPTPAPSTGRAWGQTRSYDAGVYGYCTWGAYIKFQQYSGVYPALSGDAWNWYNSARATGWSTVLDAQPNSIVVFQPYVQWAGSLGHVGWVDQTQQRSDGLYVHVVEMNGPGGWNQWDTRWVKDVPGMSYILAPHH